MKEYALKSALLDKAEAKETVLALVRKSFKISLTLLAGIMKSMTTRIM